MFRKIKFGLAVVTMVVLEVLGGVSGKVFADDAGYGIGVSPMKQKVILNPGEEYKGSFVVTNPSNNTEDFDYIVKVSPFYATENYDITYDRDDNLNQIVDWITLEHTSGALKPNETKEVKFTINVPERAPAGGQYAAIIVQAKPVEASGSNSSMGVSVDQTIGIAHTIFAEIAGTTVRKGEILSADVPSFLFSGNISGQSAIKNTGNVHGTAKYTLKVFPLFSSEEVFTNEEDPNESIILPDRTLYNEVVWNDTPSIGIFNVVYTVEFEGMTTEVSKMVIVCPLWLLFIIFFAIVMIIAWLIARSRKRGGRGRSGREGASGAGSAGSSDGGRKIAVE